MQSSGSVPSMASRLSVFGDRSNPQTSRKYSRSVSGVAVCARLWGVRTPITGAQKLRPKSGTGRTIHCSCSRKRLYCVAQLVDAG